MAQTQTTRTGNSNTLRGADRANSNIHEDLLDMFTNEDRAETPIVSSIGSSKATNVTHEWLIDNYRDPRDNAANEGADYAATDAVQNPRRRLSNFTQIFRNTVAVSGTSEAVNVAGVSSEFGYQIRKNVVELRRDIERQVVRYSDHSTAAPTNANVAAAVKSGTDPRHFGSLYTYAATHVSAAGNLSRIGGTGTATAVNATATTYDDYNGDQLFYAPQATAAVQLDVEHINSVITRMYDEGGKPNAMYVPTEIKPRTSNLFSTGSSANAGALSQRNMDAMMMKLNIAVTSVMTDFGFDLAIVPSYIMQNFSTATTGTHGASNIFFVDTNMVKRSTLRPINTKRLDDQGDGKRALIICEETLEVRNGQGVGVLYNVSA